SGNDVHSSVSGILVNATIWGRCPRPHGQRRAVPLHLRWPQPLGPLDQPKQPLPADNRRARTRLSNAPCTMANRLRSTSPSSSASSSPPTTSKTSMNSPPRPPPPTTTTTPPQGLPAGSPPAPPPTASWHASGSTTGTHRTRRPHEPPTN